MNEIPRIKIYPYGSHVKLQSNSGLTVKVYPKNKQTEVPREISEPPKLRIRKLAQSESEADKYRKIIELKNSSQDLQRLNNFFSDISKSVYEKGDSSAIRFLQFLKSPQGNYLTSHLINKALFNEDLKIQKEIQIFDEGDSGKYSDQKGLRERSGFIATQESQKPEEDIPDEIMNKMASEGRAANYIINSINLVNHLGDLTLDKLAHKLIEKIDDNIDTLNKKYPWISAPKWHCCLIKIPQRNEEQITEKASNIEFAAH